MAYSLGIRCLSEFLGMLIVIYTGEAALANELLPSTKGHAMGWGWTVFTFGFAFLAPLQIFSKVSAKLNPAMCLAQWVWGNLTGVDFICLSLAEIAGAFVGAVLHWIHYLPHYKTLPEPAATDKEDALLRRRDYMRESALQIASYATRPDRVVTSHPLGHLRHTLYYLRRGSSTEHQQTPDQVLADYFATTDDVARRRVSQQQGSGQPAQQQQQPLPLARRTIQVADLQRHLRDAQVEPVLQQDAWPKCSGSSPACDSQQQPQRDQDAGAGHSSSSSQLPVAAVQQRSAHTARTTSGLQRSHSDGGGSAAPTALAGARSTGNSTQAVLDPTQIVPGSPKTPRRAYQAALAVSHGAWPPGLVEKEEARVNALYQAAVVADQNAQLSIFATRPAIYSPLFNFITEAMGTTALLLLVLLIELQARRFNNEDFKLFYEVVFQNLLICFVVVILISGLGGATAYAANPARDFGPRLAHALLPIPGKGSSEWSYAWIPFIAPLVGGAVAGVLYIAIEEMQFPGGGPKVSGGSGLFVG